MTGRSRFVGLFLVLGACVSLAAANVSGTPDQTPEPVQTTLDWALFDRSCTPTVTSFEIPCGNYGAFYFDVEDDGGCTTQASGVDVPHVYGKPVAAEFFPVPASQTFPAVPHSSDPDDPTGSAGSGTAHDVFSLDTPRLGGSEADRSSWSVIVDFSGTHGNSVSWLVDTISGPNVRTTFVALDDPSLDPLGEQVNDFHLIGSLCRVIERTDSGGIARPGVFNMSFGRALELDDQTNRGGCDPNNVTCQLATLIGYLHDRGTTFVAAAGNHGKLLFPSMLEEVIAVGSLDQTHHFATGFSAPAWESPENARALFPGSGLCLRGGWPAPSGSSYSSALFAGWLSDHISRGMTVPSIPGERWKPYYSTRYGCYWLSYGRHLFPGCNEQIDELMLGINGENEDGCWAGAKLQSSQASGDPQSLEPPNLPSHDEFTAQEHDPTPVANPCLPCVGRSEVFTGVEPELIINMSQAVPLQEVEIDSLQLRVGSTFYAIPAAKETLDQMEQGTLGELVLEDWGYLLDSKTQSSLLLLLKSQESTDCQTEPGCYWTSVPILPAP